MLLTQGLKRARSLHRHPAVAQCAVIGVPHETWGEVVHAVVVLRAGHALELDELIEHCRARIAGFKCPRSLELRAEALPLSGVNKVNQGAAARTPADESRGWRASRSRCCVRSWASMNFRGLPIGVRA
jgi:long-chain acyl-CoA synthetase